MKELTNNELMLRFRNDGVEINIYWNGGNLCSYTFLVNGVELSRGNDYKPSAAANIDDLQTMIDLIGFLTVRVGDTDKEYFSNHSGEYLNWLETSKCEYLQLMISDYEYTPYQHDFVPAEDDENRQMAINFFTENTQLYPID